MDMVLNETEIRVVGSLAEKQLTTPEYYPLTLNALIAACNQKSNRFPVMELSEQEVTTALDRLRGKGLAFQLTSSVARVPRYEHNLTRLNFGPDEIAVLCVLLLRGPQTPGEIRARTGRMHDFKTLDEVEQTLRKLTERTDGPFVMGLPRQPGAKESRTMHLFGGLPDTALMPGTDQQEQSIVQKATAAPAVDIKIEELEKQIVELRNELAILKDRFEQFQSRLR